MGSDASAVPLPFTLRPVTTTFGCDAECRVAAGFLWAGRVSRQGPRRLPRSLSLALARPSPHTAPSLPPQPKLDKEGNPRLKKDGTPAKAETWGGYQKNAAGERTGAIGFPDDALLHQVFGKGGETLCEHVGGIFVAGGGACPPSPSSFPSRAPLSGDRQLFGMPRLTGPWVWEGPITQEQAQLYRLRGAERPGDFFVPALAVDGSASALNFVLAPGYREEALAVEEASGGELRVVQDEENLVRSQSVGSTGP